MNPESLKTVVDALPPKWVTYLMLVVVSAHALVYVGTWIANHGGLRGIRRALMDGVPPKP